MASTRVVFPWSTWAIMATLRTSSRLVVSKFLRSLHEWMSPGGGTRHVNKSKKERRYAPSRYDLNFNEFERQTQLSARTVPVRRTTGGLARPFDVVKGWGSRISPFQASRHDALDEVSLKSKEQD